MELLYFIDRTLTRVIQFFSNLVERKLCLGKKLQHRLGLLIGVFAGWIIYVRDNPLVNSQPYESMYSIFIGFLGIFYIVFLGVFFISLGYWMSLLLQKILFNLHKFFDYDGAVSQDKLYTSGYEGWSNVLIAIMGWVFYYFAPNGLYAYFIIVISGETLFGEAYIVFATRQRGKKSDLKYGVSEAMQKLLRACSGWLRPQPGVKPLAFFMV